MNKADGPINSLALPKETMSPRKPTLKHKKAQVLAQNTTSGPSNTFILEGEGHISGKQLSHNKTLGKENITVVLVEDVKANRGRGTWKHMPREPVEGKDRVGGEKAIGAKRKDTVPFRDIQQNIFNEKGARWNRRFRLWVS